MKSSRRLIIGWSGGADSLGDLPIRVTATMLGLVTRLEPSRGMVVPLRWLASDSIALSEVSRLRKMA